MEISVRYKKNSLHNIFRYFTSHIFTFNQYIDDYDYCNFNQILNYNNVIYLDCSHNLLTSLPDLPNSLVELHCEWNSLTSLPDLPNSLRKLSCKHNNLSSLPKLPSELQELSCKNNRLSFLPELPKKLKYINCKDNELSVIPELPNSLQIFKFYYYDFIRDHNRKYLYKIIYHF